MIISSGYGYLTGVIGIGCLCFTEILTAPISHDNHYYEKHGWPKLVGFWVAAVIVWPLGRDLNQGKQTELFDPWQGITSILRAGDNKIIRHDFFFMPMRYWAFIFAVLGIVFLFVTEV